jgi:hypothetical protein
MPSKPIRQACLKIVAPSPGNVLDEMDPGPGLPEQLGEGGLAHIERLRAVVDAFKLEQIEGIENG